MLKNYLSSININSDEKMLKQFCDFSDILISENEKINLTAITDKKEIEIKHFIDSLTVLKTGKISNETKLIDIGCGAGFPSFPIKFALPECDITQLDSLFKRINFQKYVSDKLGLEKIISVHFRAEEGARRIELRESFDVAVARAVASLPSLIELCVPYVKVGGYFIAMKGSEVSDELEASKNVLGTLGCEIESVIETELPEICHKRNIIVIKKLKKTDNKYPRNAPKPIKNPIL